MADTTEIPWNSLPVKQIVQDQNWFYARFASTALGNPYIQIVHQDKNVAIRSYWLNRNPASGGGWRYKDVLGYSVELLRDRYIPFVEKRYFTLIHPDVNETDQYVELVRNKEVAIAKFNSFLRPSYWFCIKPTKVKASQ